MMATRVAIGALGTVCSVEDVKGPHLEDLGLVAIALPEDEHLGVGVGQGEGGGDAVGVGVRPWLQLHELQCMRTSRALDEHLLLREQRGHRRALEA